jgi:hypothetical protein
MSVGKAKGGSDAEPAVLLAGILAGNRLSDAKAHAALSLSGGPRAYYSAGAASSRMPCNSTWL